MEDGLLVKLNDEGKEGGVIDGEGRRWAAQVGLNISWEAVLEEVKKVGWIAAPMVAVVLSQYLLTVISTMMVGHLGELYLSSSAIALSFAGVTGFSFLLGLASGLETLSGQAYGAEQFRKVGTQTYTAMFALTLVSIPLSFLWMNMDKLLVLLGQDPLISKEAGKFATFLVPTLFAYAFLQPLVRYFQCQSLIVPMLVSSVASLCIHIPLCWALVFKTRMANIGAALATGLSTWINVLSLATYMVFSTKCDKTRSTPFSMDVFKGIGEFFRFAIPSALMICLEWWSFELLILLSGLLPNPELETSVLSICLTTISTLYAIPYGVGAAGSTRVSNELGAGNPRGARVAAFGVMGIAITEGVVISLILFALRNVYGYSYSNDKEVIDYVTTMAPLVCISVIVDSLQGVLSGVARGCGWQHIGAWVNLGAFYLFGIPIAAALAFWFRFRGRGLWLGILAGSLMQTAMLFFVAARVDWQKQAKRARRRIFEEENSAGSDGEERLLPK